MIVLIDPGHGGDDPGAVGVRIDGKAVKESVCNLVIAQAIGRHLKMNGVDVRFTRDSDCYPTIRQRQNRVDEVNPNLFLSIHCNAASAKATGIETWYGAGDVKSRDMARKILSGIASFYYPLKTRGAKSDDQDRLGRIGVLHKAISSSPSCPRVLLECGFVTSLRDVKAMLDESNQKKLAQGILKAVTGK